VIEIVGEEIEAMKKARKSFIC
jgi:adenylate kinase